MFCSDIRSVYELKDDIFKGIFMTRILDDDFNISLFIQEKRLSPSQIKATRQKYGMNQLVFADLLGVGYKTYCSWELGARNSSSPAVALMGIADQYPKIFLCKRKDIIEGLNKSFKIGGETQES
jgi:DNA-binding transcriptional regulator YiaG